MDKFRENRLCGPPVEISTASKSCENFRGHGYSVAEHVSEVRNEKQYFLRDFALLKADARKQGERADCIVIPSKTAIVSHVYLSSYLSSVDFVTG